MFIRTHLFDEQLPISTFHGQAAARFYWIHMTDFVKWEQVLDDTVAWLDILKLIDSVFHSNGDSYHSTAAITTNKSHPTSLAIVGVLLFEFVVY